MERVEFSFLRFTWLSIGRDKLFGHGSRGLQPFNFGNQPPTDASRILFGAHSLVKRSTCISEHVVICIHTMDPPHGHLLLCIVGV